MTTSTLGFCIGSDRYTALGGEPGQGDEVAWVVVDAVGETVCEASLAPEPDPVTVIRALVPKVEAVRPRRFDVGSPDTMNLDLRDPARRDWDDPARTAADRVVVRTVRSMKDSFTVELSDGSAVSWDLWVSSKARP